MNGMDAGKHGETNGNPSGESYVWLERLQATLTDRQSAIAPHAAPEADEGKVRPIRAAPEPAPAPGLLERLRRRKIVQWLLGYLAAGWLLLQLNDVLASVWDVPLSTQRALSLALGLGILPALIVAWYHGERGRQEVCCAELVLVGLTGVMTVATVWQVCFP